LTPDRAGDDDFDLFFGQDSGQAFGLFGTHGVAGASFWVARSFCHPLAIAFCFS
jgi:hypothetical protein